MKILIVDDSEIDLEILEETLSQIGFQDIITSNSAMEAKVLAEELRPDLIIIDIMMPKMDGAEMKKYLNDNPKTKGIPTIFVSSLITKQEEQNYGGRLASGDVIISKPYSADDISRAIDLVLGN